MRNFTRQLSVSISFVLFSQLLFAQSKDSVNHRFFVSAGYGLSGSFFVRSYDESSYGRDAKVFYKKNFIGVGQQINFGYKLKKGFDLKAGFLYQHFTRQVYSSDTLGLTQVIFDKPIHHRDYFLTVGFTKEIRKNRSTFLGGMGLYYLRSAQEEIEIYSSFVSDVERTYKKYNLEEGGAYVEIAYQYRFQPRMDVGIRTQFNYTISTGSPESITLIPYLTYSF